MEAYLISPEHPDATTDWRAYKRRRISAHQAIEDKALQAYHEAYEKEGKEQAEKQYFEMFKMAYDSSRSAKNSHG